ncbi:hypothetical protein FLM9_937 [Candidatus Synechococcus spongiarum]|uniref:Uncharacterized protein n=1 Tax=Candidatus Synechococcus spongiarum TaxID=431041 RepID=A0A165B2P1_9SYNE|nr:hypothetical protein FLM9_937 [Candidatus Synechococcus spongiarum]
MPKRYAVPVGSQRIIEQMFAAPGVSGDDSPLTLIDWCRNLLTP